MNQTKPRGDSLGARLTPERREELLTLFIDQRASYAEGLELLSKWNITSSIGALANFYQRERSSFVIQRAKHWLTDTAKMLPGEIEEAERTAIAQKMFELAASAETSEKGLLKMRDQHIKLAQLKVAERRVVMLEAKLADVGEVAGNAKLTAEEQRARLREILK